MGYFGKANSAKEQHNIAQYKEELNLIIMEEVTERTVETKTEPMIVSLEKKINEKDWVAKTSREKQDGETVEYLIVESKEGYEFVIEVDNEKETAKIVETNKTPGEKYTITYHSNGGIGETKTVEVRKGFNKKLEKNSFTKADYIFTGWCEDKDGNGEKYMEESVIYQIDRNVTLYAIWSYNVATITFDANGGTGTMETKKVTKGDNIKLTANSFQKEGYDFEKWNTKADGTGDDYADLANITTENNVTLYAIWKKKPITADTVKKNPSDFYGAIVSNYSTKTIAGKNYNEAVKNWKIFYADNNNIYLIADDYIAYDYVPTGRGGTPLISGSTGYGVAFAESMYSNKMGMLVDYTGTDDIKDERIKALSNDYFSKGFSNTEQKGRAMAYMLDTTRWEGFSGSDADYAVGGPTIEMLMASYAEKYKVNYVAKVNNGAYYVSKNGGTTLETDCAKMLNKNDSLYVINSTEKANSMWVVSMYTFGSSNSNCILHVVTSNGDLLYSYCFHSNTGFRPIVCLKASVKLEKVSEGNYKIKNN